MVLVSVEKYRTLINDETDWEMLDSVDSTVYSVRATISMLRKNSVESKQVKGSFDPS